MNLPKNQSYYSRLLRLLISGAFIYAAFNFASTPGQIWVLAGFWFLGNCSGLSGYCPIYHMLGINSSELR